MRLDATLVHLLAVGCPYPILALGSRRPFLSLGLAVEGGDISDRQAGKVGEQPPFLTVCRWNGIERDFPHLSTRTGHAAVSISLLRSSLIPLSGFQGFRISNSNVVDRESEWRTVFLLDRRRAGQTVCVAEQSGRRGRACPKAFTPAAPSCRCHPPARIRFHEEPGRSPPSDRESVRGVLYGRCSLPRCCPRRHYKRRDRPVD
jgi:hypothetical protein